MFHLEKGPSFRVDPFSEVDWLQKSKQEVIKVVSLVKKWSKICQAYSGQQRLLFILNRLICFSVNHRLAMNIYEL